LNVENITTLKLNDDDDDDKCTTAVCKIHVVYSISDFKRLPLSTVGYENLYSPSLVGYK